MDPRAEFERVVDRMAESCMAGDWPAFRDGMILPFTLHTAGATLVVKDEIQLRQGFDNFVQMLRVQGVTDYIRPVLDADCPAPDRLDGIYESHLLRNAVRVVPSYRSRAQLRRVDGLWRFERIVNTWENDRWPVTTPIPGDTPLSDIGTDD